jgi:hypothetical protein
MFGIKNSVDKTLLKKFFKSTGSKKKKRINENVNNNNKIEG